MGLDEHVRRKLAPADLALAFVGYDDVRSTSRRPAFHQCSAALTQRAVAFSGAVAFDGVALAELGGGGAFRLAPIARRIRGLDFRAQRPSLRAVLDVHALGIPPLCGGVEGSKFK